MKQTYDALSINDDVRSLTLAVIRQYLFELKGNVAIFRIPSVVEENSIHAPLQHMHLLPEVFIQLAGFTDFTCGDESFRLNPGEVCIMPRRTPHSEKAGTLNSRPFRNIVITYGWPHLLFHVANASSTGIPQVTSSGSAVCLSTIRQIEYIEDIVRINRQASPVQTEALTGLQLAYFSTVWTTLAGHETGRIESTKTARVRQLVASRLGTPDLSVEYLARLLACHPDYLSHLFQKQTGSTLTQYINEQRILQARDMLERTSLSIKEISAAVGYSDPGYFTRVFRRLTSTTPASHRQRRCNSL